jgi:hypothetical protein
MDKDQLLRLYDLEERQNAMFYNGQREVTSHVVRFRPLPGMKGGSYILYSRLDENNADSSAQREGSILSAERIIVILDMSI